MNHFDLEKITSDRLPNATAKEYAEMMNKINMGDDFDDEVLTLLKGLLERKPNEHFSCIGFKGGSTLFVDANAFYIRDYEQNNFALGLFINDSKGGEMIWIRREINKFIFKTLTDKTFQDEVIGRLSRESK